MKFLFQGFLREDTHKKSVFFSGRTTKRGEGGNPRDHQAKNHFFSINGENSPGSCIMKILFYEVQHLDQTFPKVLYQKKKVLSIKNFKRTLNAVLYRLMIIFIS